MLKRKLCAFSPCGELFFCVNDAEILTIWDTASNNVKQEIDVALHLKTSCSSIIWGSFQIANVEENEESNNETQFLVIGTKSGDIYMYDYNIGKLYNHFISGHSGDVHDLSLHCETNILSSCSDDKSVIIWDTISGKVKQKWIVDEEVYSICLIDSKNVLTGGTSVIWWDIEEQRIIKKFLCPEAPVSLLKVVNSLDVSSSSYFLSAASGESKITAWSLNGRNSHNTVASFLADSEPQNIDTSKTFSKDKPLLMTAVTKTGLLNLFAHVLNGKTKNLTPQMTLEVNLKPSVNTEGPYPIIVPILSSKILDCAESCIIAYGENDSPIFESVNIYDCPKKLTLVREKQLPEKIYDCFVPKVKFCKSLKKNSETNGQSAPDLSYNSPKRRKVVDTSDPVEMLPNNCNEFSDKKHLNDKKLLVSSPTVKKKQKLSKRMERSKSPESEIEELVVPTDPSEVISTLLRGIEKENSSIINLVLQCDNSELIKASVENLPLQQLNTVLLELHRRLKLHPERLNTSLIRWLKEILIYHLPDLISCDENLSDVLNQISELIDIRYITLTLSRMRLLKGLLKVQKMNTSPEESDSSSSESDIEELVDSNNQIFIYKYIL